MNARLADVASAARRLETGGRDGCIVWRAWGDGPPLILLHGASGSWTHWLLNIPGLARRFTVLAPDMPGFGDSDLPAGPHTAEALAALVSAGIDAAVPPPAPLDLAGFSFGGIIAGLVAAEQGPRVQHLVLVGPNGMALPREPGPPLARIRADMTEGEARAAHRENLRLLMIGDPERADELAVDLQIANLARARFRSGAIPESDALLRALPAVRSRISGIWGGRDAFAAPYLEARREVLARFQPGLDFLVVDGAGHWVPYERPAEVDAAMVQMLAAAPAR